jgi:hypothetical protein
MGSLLVRKEQSILHWRKSTISPLCYDFIYVRLAVSDLSLARCSTLHKSHCTSTSPLVLFPLQELSWASACFRKNYDKRGPEARLYGALVAGILFPVGMFLFAWTAFPHVHWIAPVIGITVSKALIGALKLRTNK